MLSLCVCTSVLDCFTLPGWSHSCHGAITSAQLLLIRSDSEEEEQRELNHLTCVFVFVCSSHQHSWSQTEQCIITAFQRLMARKTWCVTHPPPCCLLVALQSQVCALQVIDPFESSDPRRWPDENTRQRLITECRKSSAGPYLLVNTPTPPPMMDQSALRPAVNIAHTDGSSQSWSTDKEHQP